MAQTTFHILDGHPSYKLGARTTARVKALRELQLATAYYSDRERYGLAKELCSTEWIIREEEDTERGTVTFDLAPPNLGADDFRVKVAALLFPEAPVDGNEDRVDHEEAEAALEAFLGFIEPRHRRRTAPLPWQEIFQSAQTSSTAVSPAPETATPTA